MSSQEGAGFRKGLPSLGATQSPPTPHAAAEGWRKSRLRHSSRPRCAAPRKQKFHENRNSSVVGGISGHVLPLGAPLRGSVQQSIRPQAECVGATQATPCTCSRATSPPDVPLPRLRMMGPLTPP